MSAPGRAYARRNGNGTHEWVERVDAVTGQLVDAEPARERDQR